MIDCVWDANTLACVRCGFVAAHIKVRRNCPKSDRYHLVRNSKEPDNHALFIPGDVMPPRDGPSFLEKLKNFATAAAGHIAAGMPMASDEEIIRRHDICLGCEHLQNDACNLCGCPVSRVAGYVSKLSWADQECPIGKWGKATGG